MQDSPPAPRLPPPTSDVVPLAAPWTVSSWGGGRPLVSHDILFEKAGPVLWPGAGAQGGGSGRGRRVAPGSPASPAEWLTQLGMLRFGLGFLGAPVTSETKLLKT